MLANLNLDTVLCLDIETVPQYASFDECDGTLQQLWSRKAEFLKKNELEHAGSLYNRAGIYAEFGKIICISTGFLNYREGRQFRLRSFASDDESQLLEEFAFTLSRIPPGMLLCAHNGKEFDFPYISRRMLINGLPLHPILDQSGRKPWEVPYLDTMELWKFGDYKNFTPLNLLTHILGIPSPKDDIDGSMVSEVYWKEKDLARIVRYCQKDVVAVMQVLLRLKGEPLLGEEEIVVT